MSNPNSSGKIVSRIPVSKARFEPADLLNRIAFSGEQIIIQRHEKDLAAVISMADYARLAEPVSATEKTQEMATLDQAELYRLAAIIESSNDAIIGKTLEGTITNWNPGAERLYGYSAAEVIGQSIEILLPPDRPNEVPQIIERISRGERVEHYETVRVKKDGQRIDISLTVSPIKDDRDRIIGASTIARDITERKRAEEELRTSRQQLRELSARLQTLQEEERARITHEIQDQFGQALTALKLDLAWVSKRLPVNREPLQQKLAAMNLLIDSTTQSMRKISTELRPRVLEDLGLVPAIEQEITAFQKRTGINTTLSINPEDIELPANLSIGVFRVLQDGLESIPPTASAAAVNIELNQNNQTLLLKIIDDRRPQSQPVKSIHLISLQERLLLLKGEIQLSNERHGSAAEQTVLTITIPLPTAVSESVIEETDLSAKLPSSASMPAVITAARNLPMTRILIADSHAIIREGLKQILADLAEMIVTGEASSAAEVLQKIRAEEWDIVLLDMALPGKNGLDLLKQIKAENVRVPVLMLSDEAEEQYAVRVLKAGASGCLTKETAPDELIQAVQRVARGGQYVSEGVAEKLLFDLRGDSTGPLHQTLSDREFQVLCLIAKGKKLTEIAAELRLSIKTISTYRTKLLQKMGLKNNVELVRYAIEHHLQ